MVHEHGKNYTGLNREIEYLQNAKTVQETLNEQKETAMEVKKGEIRALKKTIKELMDDKWALITDIGKLKMGHKVGAQ